MPNIHYIGNLLFGDMRAAFPFQKQPPLAVTDFLFGIDGVYRPEANQVQYDSLHECVYAAKGGIDFNQSLFGGGLVDNDAHTNSDLPTFVWDTLTVSGPVSGQCFADPGPTRYQFIDCICTTPSGADSCTMHASVASLALQGLRVHFTRSLFTAIDPTVECSYEIRIGVGDIHLPDYLTYYSVYVSNLHAPELRFSGDLGATWQTMRAGTRSITNPKAARSTTPADGAEAGMFEVLVMAGKISITMGGLAAPFVTDIPNGFSRDASGNITENISAPIIKSLDIFANQFNSCSFAVHPTVFRASAGMRSNPQPFGFAPDTTTPIYYLLYTPTESARRDSGASWSPDFPGSAWSITATNVTGGDALASAPQYDLVWTNQADVTVYSIAYSYGTVAATRVVTKVDGLVEYGQPDFSVIPLADPAPVDPSAPPDPTAPPPPPALRSLVERQVFDPGGLTIRHSLEVTLSNWLGPDYLLASTGIAGSGNFAVALDLGQITDPTQTLYRRFVGFCDTIDFTHVAGQALIKFTCVDQMQQMADTFIEAPPNMDGVYHYYAMMFLCNFAGITKDQCFFYAVADDGTVIPIDVPDDPFASDPHDPAPYFLPQGNGGHPWTPINRSLSCIEFSDQIRKVTGCLHYVDNNGFMTYGPWVRPEFSAPVRTFTELQTPDAMGTPGLGLTEIQSISTHISTRNTRNIVATIGLDPSRDGMPEIVTKLQDDASIDSPAGSQPYNYVSYRKPFIWVDTRFADVKFATSATRQLFSFMRQPEVIENIVVWPQYDIFATYVIQIEDSRSQASLLPMVIMALELMLSTDGGTLTQRENIEARYLVTLPADDSPPT